MYLNYNNYFHLSHPSNFQLLVSAYLQRTHILYNGISWTWGEVSRISRISTIAASHLPATSAARACCVGAALLEGVHISRSLSSLPPNCILFVFRSFLRSPAGSQRFCFETFPRRSTEGWPGVTLNVGGFEYGGVKRSTNIRCFQR